MANLTQIKKNKEFLIDRLKIAVKTLEQKGYTKPKHIKAKIFFLYPQFDTIKGTYKLDNVLGYKSADAEITEIIEQLAINLNEV